MDKQWYKNAKDTYKDLKDIDPDKASKEQFLLYAACVALLDHEEPRGEISLPAPEPSAQGENEAVEDAPASTSKIDTLLATLAADFQPYQEVKSEYIITPTDGNLAAVLDNLRVVLGDMRSLFSILWQSSGHQSERDEIRSFFTWYKEKYHL